MKIYVASSWRNTRQPEVVAALRLAGHEVYDFRHPAPGNEGFHWSEIDPEWKDWTPEAFIKLLDHPVANRGFGYDMTALAGADATVCVLPCGRSAHLEAGFTAGQGKPVIVLLEGPLEPELMYKMTHQCVTTIDGVVAALAAVAPEKRARWVFDGIEIPAAHTDARGPFYGSKCYLDGLISLIARNTSWHPVQVETQPEEILVVCEGMSDFGHSELAYLSKYFGLPGGWAINGWDCGPTPTEGQRKHRRKTQQLRIWLSRRHALAGNQGEHLSEEVTHILELGHRRVEGVRRGDY